MVDPNEKEDIIEIQCEDCLVEFDIRYNGNEHSDPSYCPFCGADINYEWNEDKDEEEDYDEE